MLSLEDLRFLKIVVSGKSLAEAARQLDVTPPAVSQRLSALEKRIGLKLVQRQRQGVILSNEGELVARHAERILDDFEDLLTQLAARRKQLFGPLRISAPLGFGRRYVAPLAASYQMRHPGVTVELSLNDRPAMLAAQSDICIHIGELRDSDGIVAKLADNDRILCASPAYLEARGWPETPRDLERHACLALRENEEDATLWRFHQKERSLSVRVQPTMSTNDGDVLRQWALDGYGIIIRSEWHIADDLAAGTLVRVLPDYGLATANVVALVGEARARAARVQAFLDHIRKALNPPPWRGWAKGRAERKSA